MSRQSEEISRYFVMNGILQKDAAEALGIRESTMSNILSGRYTIGRQLAYKFSKSFGFDLIFLITGEGALFPPPPGKATTIDQHDNTGPIVNGDNAGTITFTSAANANAAALKAENARLRDENAWLREEVAWLRSELTKKS